MSDGTQLTLAVHLRDDATLENFLFPEKLAPLRAALETQIEPAGEAMLLVHGPAGAGRSHLLQAACHRVAPGEALYLPLRDLVDMPAGEVLAGTERMRLIGLDDLGAVVGRAAWEEALFHLVNRARGSGCRLVMSADRPPRHLGVRLADLESRLNWAVVFQLPELTDEEKCAVLQFRARRRGMSLSDGAANYILSRSARSLGELMELLERLDRASMAARRQLSIPFIKNTLDW